MYAISTGLPFILIAYAGSTIRTMVPHVSSCTDYAGWRFGFASKTLVLLIMMVNMSINMLAEFVTIGSIFQYYVGVEGYSIIILIGVLTLSYTTYGGLLVSIYTDVWQVLGEQQSLACLSFRVISSCLISRASQLSSSSWCS